MSKKNHTGRNSHTGQVASGSQSTSAESTPVSNLRSTPANRRNFLATGSVVSAGVAAGVTTSSVASAQNQSAADTIRIGIVGLGGRGSGALDNTLTINDNIKLVATADIDESKQNVLGRLAQKFGDKVAVESGKNHVGIDAYKRILDDPEVDLVIMTTPPGFRPQYVMDAVDAGKHVFAEKPTCVDPAGYRTCLQAHEKAIANGTGIVTGTQYRRQENYVEAIRRIHAGEIGDVIGMTARYCSNGIWYRARKPGMSDTQYQIFNWMHFIWLSGDQIAEQAVHNVDVMNWVMQGPPEKAYGSGGRFTRPDDSEMWDNCNVDFHYPGDRLVSFKCRQIPGTTGDVSNHIYGSKGRATIFGSNRGASIFDSDGNEIWTMKGNIGAAYQQEHKDLVDSIRAGKPIVEIKETANSSLTAIMGRIACYTGKEVAWDFLTNKSEQNLWPEDFDFAGARPEPKFAVPGETPLV